MKKQKIKFISLIALALMLIGSTLSYAQQGPPRGPQSQGQMHQQGPRGQQDERGPKGPRIPNLTEEQKEKMKAIHLEIEKQALPLKNQVGEKEARLKTLVTAENYNESAVNNIIDEISELKGNLHKLEISSLQKAKEVLDEEQMLFLYKHMGEKKRPQKKGPRR